MRGGYLVRICVCGGGERFRAYLSLPKGWELAETGKVDLAVVLAGELPAGSTCTALLLWEGTALQERWGAQQVISCGFSPRCSLTLASFSPRGAVLSVQRAIPCGDGRCILPQDIPLPQEWAGLSAEEQLMLAGAALLLGTME